MFTRRSFIRRNLGRESNPWFTTGTRVYQFRNEPIIGQAETVVKSVVAFSLNPCQRYRRCTLGEREEHPRDSSLPLAPSSTPPRIGFTSAYSSFAEPFSRSFRADDASADLQPIRYFAWKPDIRVPFFLTFAFSSLESPSNETRGRGESPSVKIFEERKFLLGIFLDKTPVTFNFSSDK